MNKLRCFIYLFLLTETNKLSVFLLSKENNASSFAAMKRTTYVFSSETSNLSSLKAVKPTTFAKLNPNANSNPKLNPKPKQHDQFKSSENGNPKGNVVHKDKALQCFLSFFSRLHFLPVFLGNSANQQEKMQTNVLQLKTSLYAKIQQFLSTSFFQNCQLHPFSTGPFIC